MSMRHFEYDSAEVLQAFFEQATWTKFNYNDGSLIGYRKAFSKITDVTNPKAQYVEVRFGEYQDREYMVYLVFPGLLVPLPHLTNYLRICTLFDVLASGSGSTAEAMERRPEFQS